jgi:hypothetical protein
MAREDSTDPNVSADFADGGDEGFHGCGAD